VDTGIWHQVGLELRKIYVKSTIETKGGCQRRDNLSNQSVKVSVCWALDIKRTSAHIVKSLVIEAESAVGVLKKRVR
jgi:hypothetical protein